MKNTNSCHCKEKPDALVLHCNYCGGQNPAFSKEQYASWHGHPYSPDKVNDDCRDGHPQLRRIRKMIPGSYARVRYCEVCAEFVPSDDQS